MSGLDAIEFFEALSDSIDDTLKTEDFCDEYECALNRLRYEVTKSVPVQPKVVKAYSRGHTDFISCGACGFGLDLMFSKYCPKCGRAIERRLER
jgi:hypothetical protein